MSRKLFSRSHQRQFLKLSSIGLFRKARPVRRSVRSTKMLVSTVGAKSANDHVISWPSNNSISHRLKSVDVHNKAISSVIHNDSRSKIESVLLEHRHELFSSRLSRNALQRLIKQKALEIASELGLKFKGTKKWLISFVKRCELLGYINVDIVSESNGKERNSKNECLHPKATSLTNSILSNSLPVPDISNLFSNQYDVELPTEKQHSELFISQNTPPLVYITGNKHSRSKQKSTETTISSLSEKSSFKPVEKKFCDDNCLLLRKNYGLLKDSQFFSRAYFAACYTGYKLTRNSTATVNPSTETSLSVYDELYELAEKKYGTVNPAIDQHKNLNLCNKSEDSVFETTSASDCLSQNLQTSISMQQKPCTDNTANKSDSDPLLDLFSESITNQANDTPHGLFDAQFDEAPVICNDAVDPLLYLFHSDHPVSIPLQNSPVNIKMASSPEQPSMEKNASISLLENNLEDITSPQPEIHSINFTPEPLIAPNDLLYVTKKSEQMRDLDELLSQPLNSISTSSGELAQEDVDWIDSFLL